jgi:hypothetical protein
MLNIWKRSAGLAFPYEIPGPPIPIVSDAAIATDAIGDGRFVPVVIMDTTARPDITEMIEVHEKFPPGDVISAWGSINSGPRDHIALFLHFQRPIVAGLALNFDLSRQGTVVDLALRARAIYLQAGKPGDRLHASLDAPRMVAELNGEMPQRRWDELWTTAIKHRLRAEGFRNGEAKRVAARLVEETRNKFKNRSSIDPGIYVDPHNPLTDDAAGAKSNR